ncbi:protein kinase [Nocardia sp. XZ_19_385]|uniref:protein kinase domain-containing protein n=1 Tax=Nocardia sp. XZ_19_385 TaxID=2769488 RepID=UPI00189096FD|nr:protein kinase [Nocardia sp. XZ_19_385]
MGAVRFGPYRLERLLGKGGMGEVWLAATSTGHHVALKLLAAEHARDATYRVRFEREAELAAALRDPHIVPIHAHGAIDGRLFIEMAYVDGTDLAARLACGELPVRTAVDIVGQVATALDTAHGQGLVHRDIKPSNILVRPDGFSYLIDFGLARSLGASGVTATGMAIGTLAYMAPERFTGTSCDARADVYSLACVLYECLTGARPFGDTDPAQQMHAHLMAAPPCAAIRNTAIPAALDQVIARGMAKDPADRYASAGEFATAAAAALTPARDSSPHPTKVLPAPGLPPTRRETVQRTPIRPVAAPIIAAPTAPPPIGPSGTKALPVSSPSPTRAQTRAQPPAPAQTPTRAQTSAGGPSPTRTQTSPASSPTPTHAQAPAQTPVRRQTPTRAETLAGGPSPTRAQTSSASSPTSARAQAPAQPPARPHTPTRAETLAGGPALTRAQTSTGAQARGHTSVGNPLPTRAQTLVGNLVPTRAQTMAGAAPVQLAALEAGGGRRRWYLRRRGVEVRPSRPIGPVQPVRPAALVPVAARPVEPVRSAAVRKRGQVWPSRGPGSAVPPPRPAPRRKRGVLRKTIWALVIIFVAPFAFAAGCFALIANSGSGSSGSTVGNPPAISEPSPEPEPQPEPEPEVAPAGAAVRDGKFEFAVGNIESGVRKVGSQRAAGSFLIVTLTVRNISDEAKWFTPFGQKLFDDNGNQIDPHLLATFLQGGNKHRNTIKLEPGESATGKLVFDIPDSATPSRLALHDSPFSGGASVALT